MSIELRLNGTAVRTLADNGHLPGYPNFSQRSTVKETDSDYKLNKAAVDWYLNSTRQKVGKGFVYLGVTKPVAAEKILEYLDGAAGALFASEDASARAEARTIHAAVTKAVSHLRRNEVPVRITRSAYGFTSYEIGE